MKVSNQTQGQLDRLSKSGSFSTNKEILDEIVALHKDITGDDLDSKCGTCVKNAMHVINKEQRRLAKEKKAGSGSDGDDTGKGGGAKIVPFDGKKQYTDDELAKLKVSQLKVVAKTLDVTFASNEKQAPLIAKIKAAYAAKTVESPAKAKVEKIGNEDKGENKATNDEPKTQDHVVTQEDLDANSELAENDIKVGDTIQVPIESDEKE